MTADSVASQEHRAADRARLLEEQLRAVRAIGEALATKVGLDALFEKVVPNVTRLMDAERSTLFLHDPDADEIWSKVMEGETNREVRLRVGAGIAGAVARDRVTLNIANAYDDPRFNALVDATTGFHTRNVACAPVMDRTGRLLGVLQVLNHREGPFAHNDIGLLEAIAVQMAYAVENASQAQQLINQNRELEAARQREERRRSELDLLYQLEKETSASQNLDSLLDSVILRACERLRSQAGSILLLDADSGRLFFRGVVGEHRERIKTLSLAPGQGIVGWVAQHGEAIISNDPDADPRHDVAIASVLDFPATALLAVPLVWDGRVIGAVEVLNPRPRPAGDAGYDDEDLKVLTLIAAQLARSVALARARDERIATERLAFLGHMLAGVAHDLRNPMTVISGYAQIMVHEPTADQRQARCARVLHQVDEMTGMIGDLLAFARGDRRLKPATVDLTQLAWELREALDVQCKPRGIELAIRAEEATVTIDIGRVKRIISNLARNAIDALSGGGALTIGLRPWQAGGLLLDVADTGPGIPAEIRARLFQAFVTGKDNGSGLGLNIVKRFTDDHGGDITVDSEPGRGTVFTVRLPRASAA